MVKIIQSCLYFQHFNKVNYNVEVNSVNWKMEPNRILSNLYICSHSVDFLSPPQHETSLSCLLDSPWDATALCISCCSPRIHNWKSFSYHFQSPCQPLWSQVADVVLLVSEMRRMEEKQKKMKKKMKMMICEILPGILCRTSRRLLSALY